MEGKRCDGRGLYASNIFRPLNVDDLGSQLPLFALGRFGLSDETLGVLQKLRERRSRRKILITVHVDVGRFAV